MPARLVLVAALAIAGHPALAQTQTVPPAVNVQRLALVTTATAPRAGSTPPAAARLPGPSSN
jgi:hypothetical protein